MTISKLNLLIPKKLQQALEQLAVDRKHLKKLERLAGYIFRCYIQKGISFTEPIELSKKHFRKQAGRPAHDQLASLIESKILFKVRAHCNFTNQPTSNRCCSYQFNPELIDSTNLHPLLIESKKDKRKKLRSKIISRTKKALQKLTLPFNRRNHQRDIGAVVNFQITRHTIKDQCKIDSAIPSGHYKVGYINPHQKDRFKKHVELSVLLERSTNANKQLILYRDKCYIEDLERFIERKLYDLRLSYANDLLKILLIKRSDGSYLRCTRNETNNRLDTNITNIRSCVMDILFLEGEKLTGLDLSNSQFTILGRALNTMSEALIFEKFGKKKRPPKNSFLEILKDYPDYYSAFKVAIASCSDKNSKLSNDVEAFIRSTQTGQFYEYYSSLIIDQYQHKIIPIQGYRLSFDQLAVLKNSDPDLLNIYNLIRSDAKKTMFATLFSSYRYNASSKTTLKKHFPGLVKFCDNFKKEAIKHYKKSLSKKEATDKGNASLAVMLQNIEASIFIDNILSKLQDKGFTVLSKHDSILCKKSEAGAVGAFVRSELDNFFGSGKYQLKIEDH